MDGMHKFKKPTTVIGFFIMHISYLLFCPYCTGIQFQILCPLYMEQ